MSKFLKNIMKKQLTFHIYIIILFFNVTSCTNLEEQTLETQTFSSVSKRAQLINSQLYLARAYKGISSFQGFDKTFLLNEMSTDAMLGPTRGGDWDDNGAWRKIHLLTWDASHPQLKATWDNLVLNVYNCNQVLYNNGTPSEIIQARFLRAFNYFYFIDLFGQTPYTPTGANPKIDFLVWSRSQATAFVISELEAIITSLPTRVPSDASMLNQDAAHFLLAKMYLNKAVFNAANPAGPYIFSTSDMTKVVQNVDAMSNTLAPNYWDNFVPNNNTSNEIVFSSKNILNGVGGEIRSRWHMSSHYNQTPGGWNGFTTLSEYYNRYNPNDIRIKYQNSSIISNFGNPVGFHIGQQYAPGGVTPLNDRVGNPLFFTPSVTLITGGATLETAGIRGMKYIPDTNNFEKPENDYVLFRYSDALLMKVEAILRGGSGSTGTIMSDVASRTGQPAVSANLSNIYDERGRELWWEGWRRNDMVRFGKFLNQRALKPYVSPAYYLLYPIPTSALLNVNLTQNPGY
jgi:starch-binding outer membrane protein, SusD/RagB family